jgi:carbon storage regulator
MLVLCRRISESLYIGEEITVTVLAVKGNQVRFGIAAPRNVTVDREEVWARKNGQEPQAPLPAQAPSPTREDPHTQQSTGDQPMPPRPLRRKRRTPRATNVGSVDSEST